MKKILLSLCFLMSSMMGQANDVVVTCELDSMLSKTQANLEFSLPLNELTGGKPFKDFLEKRFRRTVGLPMELEISFLGEVKISDSTFDDSTSGPIIEPAYVIFSQNEKGKIIAGYRFRTVIGRGAAFGAYAMFEKIGEKSYSFFQSGAYEAQSPIVSKEKIPTTATCKF